MKNLKAFMVCLVVSVLLGVSAKAQETVLPCNIVYMITGDKLHKFDFGSNKVIASSEIIEMVTFKLEPHQLMYLDLWDANVRKNIFDRNQKRLLEIELRDGKIISEVHKSYNEGLKFFGSEVKRIRVHKIIEK